MHVHLTRAVHIRLIHDLDGSHIGIVAHIEREVHIVLQEEIHEAALLILRQFGEDKCLWFRLHHLNGFVVIANHGLGYSMVHVLDWGDRPRVIRVHTLWFPVIVVLVHHLILVVPVMVHFFAFLYLII